MRKLLLALWPLACSVALSSCAANSPRVAPPPACPRLPAIPAELMQPPNYEQQLRELWLSGLAVMPASGRYKPC